MYVLRHQTFWYFGVERVKDNGAQIFEGQPWEERGSMIMELKQKFRNWKCRIVNYCDSYIYVESHPYINSGATQLITPRP